MHDAHSERQHYANAHAGTSQARSNTAHIKAGPFAPFAIPRRESPPRLKPGPGWHRPDDADDDKGAEPTEVEATDGSQEKGISHNPDDEVEWI